MRLTDQQSLRIAELPEDYWVIGVDSRAPTVCKPTGQLLRIQQNGRPAAAKRRLAERRAGEVARLGGVLATTPYTRVLG